MPPHQVKEAPQATIVDGATTRKYFRTANQTVVSCMETVENGTHTQVVQLVHPGGTVVATTRVENHSGTRYAGQSGQIGGSLKPVSTDAARQMHESTLTKGIPSAQPDPDTARGVLPQVRARNSRARLV